MEHFLPNSWNLKNCFQYYFNQEGFWSTKSIDAKYEAKENIPRSSNESQTNYSPNSTEIRNTGNKENNIEEEDTDQNEAVEVLIRMLQKMD